MTEKDLLLRLIRICEAYREEFSPISGCLTSDEVGDCLVYLSSLIIEPQFDRDDKDQWNELKWVLYERLEKKSPQTMFELSLGLPEGVGSIVLDEITYGRMFINEYYQIGLRK
jgi:hypothetical protein